MTRAEAQHPAQRLSKPVAALAPGVALTVGLGAAAYVAQQVEVALIGHAVIEALVIAILLGMLWRNLRGVAPAAQPGVQFTAKRVLELAIVLLGASVDLPRLLAAGPRLLLAIVTLVAVSLAASMLIGRALGLNPRLAILVAAGNAICGNSAIAAIAPVIRARKEDVASAIALTALLGVLVVLTLPLLIPLFGLTYYQYGVLAGMTVYAVPQVLAATFPISPWSGEVGTLVKLVRVLLLGPVVLLFSLLFRERGAGGRPGLGQLVPWFIAGFVALGALRSLGLLPASVAEPLRELSRWLTVAAMAALGLGVDIHSLRQVGPAVAAAVLGSLAVLIALSLLLIRVFGIAGL
ncbi:MAG TPA: putative sulfate exporter family transporter [Chloroflexaceae bacterium]|nr:putative sulfate exporter family transporter [Chloroflexaceae bacterium]